MPLISNLVSAHCPSDAASDFGLSVCAPMVRYSKLAFRNLVRLWGCDVVYTPMILADAFERSIHARDSELTINQWDADRLIVQFAADRPETFVSACQLVEPYCNGVNLNCGCPQGWAMKEGIGACLMHKPELVADMVRQTRNRISKPDFDLSVKIRIHDDPKLSVEFARRMEAVGADHLTVHGRTREQRTQSDVNWEVVKDIKAAIKIPLIANGDIRSVSDALEIRSRTGVDGFMAARGLLANPAMFSGFADTPAACISDWLALASLTGTPLTCFHHHLIYMCDRMLPRAERKVFNTLGSTAAIVDYLESNYGIVAADDVIQRLEEKVKINKL